MTPRASRCVLATCESKAEFFGFLGSCLPTDDWLYAAFFMNLKTTALNARPLSVITISFCNTEGTSCCFCVSDFERAPRV